MHNDPRSRTAASPHSPRKTLENPFFTTTKAPNYGAFVFPISFFVSTGENLARPLQYLLQVIRFTTRFGDLGTGRPGNPLFTPGSQRQRAEPTLLGSLVQAGRGFPLYTGRERRCASPRRFGASDTGRSGVPSLHRPRRQRVAAAPFGNLGTGRPGIPSFIARADESPAASGHRPPGRPSRPAAAAPPPASATIPRHSTASASSRLCR